MTGLSPDAYFQDFLPKRVLEKVPIEEGGHVVDSLVFLVPKPSGDWRMIINQRFLNNFIKRKRIHMETIRSVAAILRQGDFMATLDLKEAYLHVPVFQTHRRF